MDIRKPEYENLKRLVQEWIDHPEQELEATFGVGGAVSATTFAAIAKRLKNRGYTSITQEDRLNIITQANVRISMNGIGVIQQYCRDDRLNGKKFTAMIKQRTATNANLDLQEYNVRVKMRGEVEINENSSEMVALLDQWATTDKAFRILRRWTFRGEGLRFDLSMVRSSRKDARGNYRWVKKFLQQDISKDLPIYEVEVEMERVEGDTATAAVSRLIKGIGEVLRGIQKNSLLISNTTKRQVIQSYQGLTKTDKFRGAATMTLELQNMLSLVEPGTPNVREGYNVTDKADGLRTMGFVDAKGHLYLIDGALNVYETGLVNTACATSLVDGEWITKNSADESVHMFCIFDIYIAAGARDVHKLPFFDGKPGAAYRYNEMKLWEKAWNTPADVKEVIKGLTTKTRLAVSLKKFRFGKSGDTSIFTAASEMLDAPHVYTTDGLIFTKNDMPLPDIPMAPFRQQFKWKPAHDNTIDFMVVTEKIPGTTADAVYDGIHPSSGKAIRYKSLRLHVGSRNDPSTVNPRETVLMNLPLPSAGKGKGGPSVYRPVLFHPREFSDSMANTCYIEVVRELESGEEYAYCEVSGEPITDKSIVEIFYDPSRPPGWRWVPKLVRTDKTERLLRGELGRTLNSDETAQSIWNSIHEPITLSMIRTGAEEPTKAELDDISTLESERAAISQRYMDRKAPEKDLNKVRGLRDFHNKYIKEVVLYGTVMKRANLALLDIGVGKAVDIQKWRRVNAGAVLGIDIAGDSINNPNDGAYKRLMDTMDKNGRESVLPMAFAIGDGSKNFVSGEAGATPEDSTILRSVFGQIKAEGAIPPYIDTQLASRFKAGADVISCMFAVHYFFASKEMFDGFLQNIAQTLKVGGYFIGCCFDGEKTFEFLRGREARQGIDADTVLWTITRKYDSDEIPPGDEAFGMAIDVNFISIGAEHREYLVPLQLLKEKMRTIGCELCPDADLKSMGLEACTNMFGSSWDMAAKKGRRFPMSEAVKQFSFLSRWFIFKRVGESAPSDGVAGERAAIAEPTDGLPEEEGVDLSEAAVAAGSAVAPAVVAAAPPAPPAGNRKYAAAEVLQFYQEATLQDRLKIGNQYAMRHIAPGTLFPISDPADPTQVYPSIEHFMAGMRYKYATDKPTLATAIFGQESPIIHQKFENLRRAEMGPTQKPLHPNRDAQLLTEEVKAVHAEMKPAAMKKHNAKFDEVKWNGVKEGLLEEAVKQRYAKDQDFRTILEAAKQQGKTLLFYTGSASSEYGGKRTAEGVIEGENKLGKMMMKVAGFA